MAKTKLLNNNHEVTVLRIARPSAAFMPPP